MPHPPARKISTFSKGHSIVSRNQSRKRNKASNEEDGGDDDEEEEGGGGRAEWVDREPPCSTKYDEYLSNSATVNFPTRSQIKPLPLPALHTTLKQEFDAKKQQALAVFQKVQAQCDAAGGKKFFDKEFFLGRRECLYPENGTPDDCTVTEPGDMARIEDLFPGAPLFSSSTGGADKVDASDMQQGSCGDCFMIAAIAGLAAFSTNFKRARAQQGGGGGAASPFSDAPDPISRIIVGADLQRSCYCVLFFVHGQWEWIIVDGIVPTDEDCQRPLFATCSDEHPELWPMVLEKAFMKLHKSADSCDGGSAAAALCTMSGGIQSPVDIKKLRWAKLHELGQNPFNTMATAVRDDVTASGDGGAAGGCGEESGPRGLYKGHAYTVLRVAEADKKGFVQVQNPWLSGEWTGDWSDKSKLWKKFPHYKKQLDYVDKEDGKFWQSAADFKKYMELELVSFCSDQHQVLTQGGVFGSSGRPADDIFMLKVDSASKSKSKGGIFRFVLGQHHSRFAAAIMGTSAGHKIVKGAETWNAVGANLELTLNQHSKGCPTPHNFDSSTKKKIGHRDEWWAETIFVDIPVGEMPSGYISIVPQIEVDDELENPVAVPYYVRVIAPADAELTFFTLTKGLHGAVGKQLQKLRIEAPAASTAEKPAAEPAAAAKPGLPKPVIPVQRPSAAGAAGAADADPDAGADADGSTDESSDWSDFDYDEEGEEWEECEEDDDEDDDSEWSDSYYGSEGSDFDGCWESDEEWEWDEEEEEEEEEEAGEGAEDSAADTRMYRQWFRDADENDDGVLSKSECMALFCKFAPELSPSQAQRRIRAADADGNGVLSFGEFCTIARELKKWQEDEEEEEEEWGNDDDDEDDDE